MTVLAVDPGSHKCGLALVAGDGRCLRLEVVRREELVARVRLWIDEASVDLLLVGGATGSRPVIQELQKATEIEMMVVDEFRTTERARRRYFRDHPPQGFWKWVPLGLQVPSVAIDDYAALVMAEDYLARPSDQRKEEKA